MFPNNMVRLNDERIVQIENIFFLEENILNIQGKITPAYKKKVVCTFDQTHLSLCILRRWIRIWSPFNSYTLKRHN